VAWLWFDEGNENSIVYTQVGVNLQEKNAAGAVLLT